MTKTIVIAGYKRSPFHFAHKGALAKTRPDDLAATVTRALIAETNLDASLVDDLILGCAFPEGEQGFNIGRLVVNLAGLPISVAGVTVNRFCGSSMQSIHMAAGALMAGMGECYLAGGVESMSRIPMGGFNPLPNPRIADIYPPAYISMGETAENLAKKYTIPRTDQEKFALQSHLKATAAQKAGHFTAEIVPIDGITHDGCIRPDTTLDGLASLKPAFDANGTITAATSSPLTDGAVMTIVCTLEFAQNHGLTPLAKIRAMAVAGCGAEIMGIGPVPATQKALKRAGLTINDIDLIELNEAFAAQGMSVIRELGLDENKINLDGGAIALGHPLGASGARITGKATSLLKREKKPFALATMCIGGGQGIATILEAV
jgi:acetyl-CoA acyltransferase